MAARVPQPEGDQLYRYGNRFFSQFSVDHQVYCVPVDEAEQQRFDDLDQILRELFRGRTVLPPNFPPSRRDHDEDPAVLDCGCGNGVWIERLLDEFEDCDVTGVDVFFGRGRDPNDEDEEDGNGGGNNGVQEYIKKRWNLNARFREDRSHGRLRPETFDLINSRLLAEGIDADRWPSYIRELKYLLKPGGWLQMVELHLHFQSDSGLLSDESCLTRWWQWYSSTLERMRKNPRIGRDLQRLLTAEGFDNITSRSLDIPIGDWKPAQTSLGNDNRDIVHQMLTSLSLWPFMREGHMSADNYRNLVRGGQAELRDPRYRLYYKVYVVFGQRPGPRR